VGSIPSKSRTAAEYKRLSVGIQTTIRFEGGVRGWWLRAALAALVDRSMTFAYFIPTILRLTRDERISQPQAVATALQWVRLGHVRHAVTLVAWLAALKAFALLAANSQNAGSP